MNYQTLALFLLILPFGSKVQAIEILPLQDSESYQIHCSEMEHQRLTQLKNAILKWENQSLYLKDQIEKATVDWQSHISSLKMGHKHIQNDLQKYIDTSRCFMQKRQAQRLQNQFATMLSWTQDLRPQQALRLCEIQIKNTAEVFERGIASLEENRKHHAILYFGEATFEVDRIMKTRTDCRQDEKMKLEEIRLHALRTLNQI